MEWNQLLNRIERPVVCAKCEAEVRSGAAGAVSLREYGRLEAGFTALGVQIWCRRHDVNVCHIDFGGRRLEADMRCLERKDDSPSH
jgi:hypothetical protein